MIWLGSKSLPSLHKQGVPTSSYNMKHSQCHSLTIFSCQLWKRWSNINSPLAWRCYRHLKNLTQTTQWYQNTKLDNHNTADFTGIWPKQITSDRSIKNRDFNQFQFLTSKFHKAHKIPSQNASLTKITCAVFMKTEQHVYKKINVLFQFDHKYNIQIESIVI